MDKRWPEPLNQDTRHNPSFDHDFNQTAWLRKNVPKISIFMTSYLITIHDSLLIFTIMQIKPRLLIHIQTIMQIRPDPWPLKWPFTPSKLPPCYQSVMLFKRYDLKTFCSERIMLWKHYALNGLCSEKVMLSTRYALKALCSQRVML